MRNQNCTIYVVRHGETEGNVKKILQGHTDFPLTEKGIKQAQELAVKLKNIHFDEAYSSDLLRAKRTAQIITLEKKIVVKTTQAIRERSFGTYENKTYEEVDLELKDLIDKFEKMSNKDKFKHSVHTEFESDEKISTRLILFLRELAVANVGKTILVVCHGGIMRATLIRLGFGSYSDLPLGAVKNLGYFVLESDGVDFEIKETWNIEKLKK